MYNEYALRCEQTSNVHSRLPEVADFSSLKVTHPTVYLGLRSNPSVVSQRACTRSLSVPASHQQPLAGNTECSDSQICLPEGLCAFVNVHVCLILLLPSTSAINSPALNFHSDNCFFLCFLCTVDGNRLHNCSEATNLPDADLPSSCALKFHGESKMQQMSVCMINSIHRCSFFYIRPIPIIDAL